MTYVILSCLKHIAAVSNRNLVQIADGLLCRRKEDVAVDWVGGSKAGLHRKNLNCPINFRKCQLFQMRYGS